MKATGVVRLWILVALVAAIGQRGWRLGSGHIALAQPDVPAFTVNASGTVGEGDDFATTVLGDPWDMNEQTDVMLWNDFPNATINSGVFSYNVPPTFWAGVPLLMPSGNQVDVGKIGVLYPIDTALYHWLSFRIKQPANSNVAVIWNFGRAVTDDAHVYIPVTTSEWQTYVIDLRTYSTGRMGSWTGQVTGLHLLSNAPSGSLVSIDWARLTADNPANNSLNILWSGLSSGTVDFYLDTASSGCNGALIHAETSAQASGSFVWGNSSKDTASPANFAPGTYYVCAKSGGSIVYSGGQVTINQAPIFRFTKPSFTGGPDYATDIGNPWDMNDATDLFSTQGGTASFSNGILAFVVPSNQKDPQIFLNVPDSIPIDSARYHYLTYKLWVNYPYLYYTDRSQFGRIYWGETDIQAQSQLIYVFPGWQTYSVDLRTIPLTGLVRSWTSANWNRFRLDPISNLYGLNVTFYLDDVKLTADETADTYADIQWQMTDPDTSVTTATLYYDTDQSGLNGTLFATLTLTNGARLTQVVSPLINTNSSIQRTGELTPTVFLPLVVFNYHSPCTGACYTWDTTTVLAGTYYLYACLDDGHNQACRYSETPLIINHP
jgi:hypothetical protein